MLAAATCRLQCVWGCNLDYESEGGRVNKYDQMPCCGKFRLACACERDGMWLTRKQVERAMWGCGCGGFYNQLDEASIKRELDELFGKGE